jgi:murein L,D-transpeptidase YafK
MYILKYFVTTFFLILSMVLLTACKPEVSKNKYNLKECKKELLYEKDYDQDEAIDRIVVVKKYRKMYLYKNGKLQQTIPVSLGRNPVGHKKKEGDGRTPEGEYRIYRKICSSKYYRSLCISYPRPSDRAKARSRGVSAGGNITIHAQPAWNANGKADKYTLSKNWTEGCVAVTNSVMKELWYAVDKGTPITIK